MPKRAAAARIQSANVGANFACCVIFYDFLKALWALAPGHPVPKRAAAACIQSANVGANFACCEIFHDFLNANMLSLQAWVVTYLIGFLLTETAYHS